MQEKFQKKFFSQEIGKLYLDFVYE